MERECMDFGSYFLIMDVVCIALGVFLIIAPNKAYMIGRRDVEREQMKIPQNWPVVGRVIGVAAVLLSVLFIYLEVRR